MSLPIFWCQLLEACSLCWHDCFVLENRAPRFVLTNNQSILLLCASRHVHRPTTLDVQETVAIADSVTLEQGLENGTASKPRAGSSKKGRVRQSSGQPSSFIRNSLMVCYGLSSTFLLFPLVSCL
jgi:hypothetical protein